MNEPLIKTALRRTTKCLFRFLLQRRIWRCLCPNHEGFDEWLEEVPLGGASLWRDGRLLVGLRSCECRQVRKKGRKKGKKRKEKKEIMKGERKKERKRKKGSAKERKKERKKKRE